MLPQRLVTGLAHKLASSMSTGSAGARRALSTGIIRTEGVVESWANANAVCFDVDSTVVTEEGIDVLADHCGAGEAVAEWTLKAMSGNVPFHEALQARLDLFKPSLKDIEDCHKAHPLVLTPGIETLVKTLQSRGTDVYFVSGGFRQMINPLAAMLNVPENRIFANTLLFDEAGKYVSFDPNEPTSRAGGKAKVVQHLKDTYKYDTVFVVGDGATDMEARPPADYFIGFGGIAVREVVKDGADWFITDFEDAIAPLR